MVIIAHNVMTKLNSSTVNYVVKTDKTDFVTDSLKKVACSDQTVVKSDSSPSLKILDELSSLKNETNSSEQSHLLLALSKRTPNSGKKKNSEKCTCQASFQKVCKGQS